MKGAVNLFIVAIEGPDGVGKSTIVEELERRYKGQKIKVATQHFPRYDTPIGKLIESQLYNGIEIDYEVFQMLYALDRMEYSNKVIPYLDMNGIELLILDRYSLSAEVYALTHKIKTTNVAKLEMDCVIPPDLTIILERSYGDILKDMQMSGKQRDVHETEETIYESINNYYLLSKNRDHTVYVNCSDTVVENVLSIQRIIDLVRKW